MPVTAAATAVTAAVGAGTAYFGNRAQQNRARDAQAAQMAMYNQSRADLAPFMQSGQGAMRKLAMLYGIGPDGQPLPGGAFSPEAIAEFERSPDYAFALQQGNKAIQNQYSKIYGGVRGGNQMRGIADYNQGLATQNFGNYRSALENLAKIGAGSAGQAGSIGASYAGGIAGSIMGQSAAPGIIGMGNAITGAIQSGANNYNFNQAMERFNRNQSAYSYPSHVPYSGVYNPSPQYNLFPPPQSGIGVLPNAPY